VFGFRKLTIRRKLILTSMLASMCALLLACSGFVIYDLFDFRRQMSADLTAVAGIVGINSSAALAFDDRPSADEVLTALKAKPQIVRATLFDSQGEGFTSWTRPGTVSPVPSPRHPDGTSFIADGQLYVYRDVSEAGERFGTVVLQSDLSLWQQRFRRYAWITLGLLVCAGLLAYAVTSRLQGAVSEPIQRLAKRIDQVSTGADYSLRVEKTSDDEVGVLIQGFNGMLEGIQERDAALQQANDNLENRVRDRTEALEQEIAERKRTEVELHQAMEAADAGALAKTQFLAAMSHEIRTPMNAVIGMTGLLLDTEQTAEQREFTRIIRDSGESLLVLVNDILDFSKIEAGQVQLEHRPFNLRECLESSLDLLSPRASEKGLDLAYLIEPGTPVALIGDVTRLRAILLNLIGNAVKFTERGEVAIRVSGCALAGDGRMLHFTVRDTGIGIPAARMNRLFQAFSQVDASTTRRYGGTGLGLAISKRLAEMMGGRIWVESVPGEGSAFHFTIEAQENMNAGPQLRAGTQPDLAGRRLLIVDDNGTNRQLLSLQAESWGMVPVAYSNAREALERVQAGDSFDVAVLDIQMPDMDGVTLAAEIRRLRDARTLPLLALSSIGRKELDTSTTGFNAFLNKPIKQSQLYNTLVAVLTGVETPEQHVAGSSQFDANLARSHPLRILIAEDTAVNQKLIATMLGRMGYRADVAANGREALEALRRQRYDVVLMDVQMPEMDGLEATGHIRRDWDPGEQPRIVALTANAMAEDRDICLKAGMDDYLSKPVQVRELQDALRRSSEWRRTRDGDPEPIVTASPGAEAESKSSDSVLDPTTLASLREMQAEAGPGLFQELLELFQADAAPRIAEMHRAIESGDPNALRHAAHGLKGAASNLGATTLAATCLALERIGKEGSVSGAGELMRDVEPEYERACAALQREIEGSQ